MPITRSAKKALRQASGRRERNDNVKRVMRDSLKELARAIEAQEKDKAKQLLNVVYKKLDKAAKKGVIERNAASRKKSRLARAVASLKS
jgi:small subunit ribosomal protein S20